MGVDATPSAARAPNDVSMPRRARDESVPRGSLSPLCDALFVETVSTMPGVGAHEMRGGREHTETCETWAAIDHFSSPTPLTCLKVHEYHVKQMCITFIHRLRRETRPTSRSGHRCEFRGK